MNEFSTWLRDRHDITAAVEWDRVLALFHGDERDAFDAFFVDFDQFCAERRTTDGTGTDSAEAPGRAAPPSPGGEGLSPPPPVEGREA